MEFIVRAIQMNKSMVMGGILIGLMTLSGCQSTMFKRQPVPDPRYVPTIVLGEIQNLTILPARVSCASTLPMQCLLAKTTATGEVFQIPYDWIEGFEARPGTEYQISARPQIDEGRQSLTGHWTLQKIISQRQVAGSQ